MSEPQPEYHGGDQVRFLSDKSRVGTVVGEPRFSYGEFFYRVRLFSGGIRTVPEADLEPLKIELSPEELFIQGSFGDLDDLLRLVTFSKLATPLENTLYSLGASRTEFYAHQYKPLLKFLDSGNHRLLIADEVGLGKTIEAGLIMVELRARRALRQVLVVCPKALAFKWQEEMWRRFDEEFQILTSQEFRRLVNRLADQGELGDLRAIISLQSLRQEVNRELLQATQLPLDLLIVDEAHHLRNPLTDSHKVVDSAGRFAHAVLLLTATPIHLGNENLFHLLALLDPGEFGDFATFEQRLRANAPVIQAERLVRSSFPPPIDEIRARIKEMGRGAHSSYFVNNPFYRELEGLLEYEADLSRDSVARIQDRLKELNLLSHVFTRTRKREVWEEGGPRRTAQLCQTDVKDEEISFYLAVTEFIRSEFADGLGAAPFFAASAAQRQMASCMQAAKAKYVERALQALADPEETDLADDFVLGLTDEDAPSITLPERVLEAARSLGETDSKFDRLCEELDRLEEAESGRKIILFSYFKGTLRYLDQRLADRGYACLVIHGDIRSTPGDPERDERSRRMAQFRDDPRIRVLLSSEVGSEGLDFQFCHILINYDLPWNPMRVEQRIGRLDRLGQKSGRIIIINLSMPGTIEDRILHRLYERIGIFEESIGDLEAIIGDVVQKLTMDLLTRHLTPEEEEERIEQAAQALSQGRLMLDRLEKEGSSFVGRDLFFEEQLERARTGGEYLASSDLRAFLGKFLSRQFPRSRLRGTTDPDVFDLVVDEDLDSALRTQPSTGALRHKFLRNIHRSHGTVRVSFDSESAFGNDSIEFLAPHHPLIQLAVSHYEDHLEELYPTFSVGLAAGEEAPSGVYLATLNEVQIHAGGMRRRLQPFFLDLSRGIPLDRDSSSGLLGRLLRKGEEWQDFAEVLSEEASEALQVADDMFLERLAEDREELQNRHLALAQTRLVSLETTHQRRLKQTETLLNQARRLQRDKRIIRMYEGTIRNMKADFDETRRRLKTERTIRMESRLVGCGLVRVGTP